MRGMDMLWINARLMTMAGDGLGVVHDGAIACRDGRIAYVGDRAGAPAAAEVVDCAGRIIGHAIRCLA